ncbi:MAG: DNA alkylation repair protein [Oscillospiraceae bacterium]|jgi:3-methyladenine DNA glycosylase AlkD|nr:DNA alkylation repair protein [Oscillospiraceae bacterium]
MSLKGEWSKKKYNRFLTYLDTFADLKYKEFNLRLINDNSVEYIGVRTPILRKIAKEIANNDYCGFLKFNKHRYYEERVIHGFIIGYANLNYIQLFDMFRGFIPYMSSWALTDMVSTKFKQILKNKDIAFEEIIKFIKSSNSWEVRFGLILILKIYIEKNFIDRILEICTFINKKHQCCVDGEIPYYVKIGNAWLISECFVSFSKKTEALLQSNILDGCTKNKAIQKIKESKRVPNNVKQRIEKLKVVV